MLTMLVFGPKFPSAPSIMSIVCSFVVHCWSSQKLSTPQFRPPILGPHSCVGDKPKIYLYLWLDLQCANSTLNASTTSSLANTSGGVGASNVISTSTSKDGEQSRGCHRVMSCGFFIACHVVQWEPLTHCSHWWGLCGWRVEFQMVDDLRS